MVNQKVNHLVKLVQRVLRVYAVDNSWSNVTEKSAGTTFCYNPVWLRNSSPTDRQFVTSVKNLVKIREFYQIFKIRKNSYKFLLSHNYSNSKVFEVAQH